MNDENDLQKMYAAQRKVDESLAPTFDDMAVTSTTAGKTTPSKLAHSSMPLPVPSVVLAAIMLIVIIGIASSIFSLNQDVADVSLEPQADFQQIDNICDTLGCQNQTIGYPNGNPHRHRLTNHGLAYRNRFVITICNTRI